LTENDEQGEWTLPDGWEIVPVRDVFEVHYGKGLVKSKRDESGKVPVYGSSGVVGYHIEALVDGPCIVVGRKGAVGQVYHSKVPCWPIDTTYYIQPPKGFSLEYVSYVLDFINLGALDKSTAIPGLNRDDFYSQMIPIPPSSEQRRIVAEIETQFTRLDAAVAALERAQANIRRYKAAVLKAACEGQLVPIEAELARTEGCTYEPADQLLARILAERRARWEKQNPGKKYKEPALPDTEGLPELPEGWVWTNFDQITDMVSGKAFKKAEYSESGARLLQIANITFGQIIWESQTYLPLDYLEKYPNLVLKAGDMLMALNRPILGGQLKVGVLGKRDTPAILYQRVGRFDFYHTPVKPYFFWYAQSPLFVRQLENSLQGVDQPFVTKTRLMGRVVPLPPLAEQDRIVAEVERRLSVVGALEASVEAALVRAGRLRQAVLKQAFEGRLVPQDPDDEPALVLLERIRAQREARTTAKGKQKVEQMRLPTV
jgi:type I restriction enzyme S subunit